MSDLSARRAKHASHPLFAAKQDTTRKTEVGSFQANCSCQYRQASGTSDLTFGNIHSVRRCRPRRGGKLDPWATSIVRFVVQNSAH